MGYVIEKATEFFQNQRTRIFLVVGGAALAVAGVCALIIFLILPNKSLLPGEISCGDYTETAIEGLEMRSTFSKSILTTKQNTKLFNEPYIIDNSKEYQNFLEEYDNITVLDPEQVPLVDDWFEAGYYALICSTEAYGVPVDLYAAMWASDEDGTITVVMKGDPINEDYTYSEDPNNCVQPIAVVFLPQDVIQQAEHIEILF